MALLEVTLTAILGQPEMERLAEEARDLDLAALLDLAEAHH